MKSRNLGCEPHAYLYIISYARSMEVHLLSPFFKQRSSCGRALILGMTRGMTCPTFPISAGTWTNVPPLPAGRASVYLELGFGLFFCLQSNKRDRIKMSRICAGRRLLRDRCLWCTQWEFGGKIVYRWPRPRCSMSERRAKNGRPTFVKFMQTPAVGEMHNIMNSLREKEKERPSLLSEVGNE